MAAVATAPASLEELRGDDQNFPHEVLVGCETALVLFAAGFHGRQDAVWIADAGLRATCVDVDGVRLEEMRVIYPDGWQFVTSDAYVFAAMTDRQWDVVTADPYTNQFDRCADSIAALCRVARRAVVIGVGPSTVVTPPQGWKITGSKRRSDYGGGVFWLTLERA